MAHFEGKRYSCSCLNGTCDMNCRMYRIAAGKPSNADLIRSMTDEELAWELCRIVRMPFYKDDSEIDAYEVDCWAKWLKQEASDDNDDH